MNKEQIEKRILDLKKENDKINQDLVALDAQRQQLLQQAIQNNGRILELEEVLKSI